MIRIHLFQSNPLTPSLLLAGFDQGGAGEAAAGQGFGASEKNAIAKGRAFPPSYYANRYHVPVITTLN